MEECRKSRMMGVRAGVGLTAVVGWHSRSPKGITVSSMIILAINSSL